MIQCLRIEEETQAIRLGHAPDAVNRYSQRSRTAKKLHYLLREGTEQTWQMSA